jgi:hypothetical protein
MEARVRRRTSTTLHITILTSSIIGRAARGGEGWGEGWGEVWVEAGGREEGRKKTGLKGIRYWRMLLAYVIGIIVRRDFFRII